MSGRVNTTALRNSAIELEEIETENLNNSELYSAKNALTQHLLAQYRAHNYKQKTENIITDQIHSDIRECFTTIQNLSASLSEIARVWDEAEERGIKENEVGIVNLLSPLGYTVKDKTPEEVTEVTKYRSRVIDDDDGKEHKKTNAVITDLAEKKDPDDTKKDQTKETVETLDDWNKLDDKKDSEKLPEDDKLKTDPTTGEEGDGDIIVEDPDDTTNDNKDTPETPIVPTPNNNQNSNNNVQQNTYNPHNNQSTVQNQSVQNNTQPTPEVEQPTETPTTDSITDTDNGDISIIDKENDTDNVIKIEKPKITKTDETPSKSSGSKVIPIGLGVAAAGAATAGGIKYVNDKKNNSTSAYDENYDYEEHDLLKEDSDDDKEDEQQTYTDEYSNYSEESIDSTSNLGTEPIDNSFKYQAGTVNKIAVEGSYEDDLNIEEDLSLDDEESELE